MATHLWCWNNMVPIPLAPIVPQQFCSTLEISNCFNILDSSSHFASGLACSSIATHCNLQNSSRLVGLLRVEESQHTDHDKKESRQHNWDPETGIYPHHHYKENQQHNLDPKTWVYPHLHLTPFCFFHVVMTSSAEFNWSMQAITMLNPTLLHNPTALVGASWLVH
jgi:hypothetical protein